jgi:hypothetical protein
MIRLIGNHLVTLSGRGSRGIMKKNSTIAAVFLLTECTLLRRNSGGLEKGLVLVLYCGTRNFMKLKHKHTLELIFSHPISGNIRWNDIILLFLELGAEVKERQGSRVEVFLFGQVRVYHRPHPKPDTDKGAVASIRKWLEQHGVKP